jgi:hypothetical protein
MSKRPPAQQARWLVNTDGKAEDARSDRASAKHTARASRSATGLVAVERLRSDLQDATPGAP